VILQEESQIAVEKLVEKENGVLVFVDKKLCTGEYNKKKAGYLY